MEIPPMFMIRRMNIVLLKATYRFSAMPIKTQMPLFAEIEK
jgi:hypothetical protein